jgi:hypothetical protein
MSIALSDRDIGDIGMKWTRQPRAIEILLAASMAIVLHARAHGQVQRQHKVA